MSRFPTLSTAGDRVPASIFAKLREHLAKFPGDVIPLQIGDTHLAPPARLDEVEWAEMTPADLYAYGNPAGWPALLEAIAAARACRVEQIQIACGATHALSCAVQALTDPGDEMILLSPHWPLIKGMCRGFHVTPVEVGIDASLDELERAVTSRTSVLYFATPNNPDGTVLTRDRLRALGELAQRHELWIIADEVYEDYVYDGAEHVSIASLPGLAERTVTVSSFAKSYAQAGLRIGYAIAPERIAGTLKKLVNHSVYNVPVALQRAALGALTHGAAFLAEARTRYATARTRARTQLGPALAPLPLGGAYLWVDLRRWGSDCMGVLERCAGAGVLLAPGHAFGDAYAGFARLCFTGVTEARLEEGIARVRSVLEA